jgi:hypothetical protein
MYFCSNKPFYTHLHIYTHHFFSHLLDFLTLYTHIFNCFYYCCTRGGNNVLKLFLTLLHSDTSTYNCFTTAVLAGGNNVLKLFDLLHTSIIILLLLYSPGVIICLCSFNLFHTSTNCLPLLYSPEVIMYFCSNKPFYTHLHIYTLHFFSHLLYSPGVICCVLMRF